MARPDGRSLADIGQIDARKQIGVEYERVLRDDAVETTHRRRGGAPMPPLNRKAGDDRMLRSEGNKDVSRWVVAPDEGLSSNGWSRTNEGRAARPRGEIPFIRRKRARRRQRRRDRTAAEL